jgi:hypothetical protein
LNHYPETQYFEIITMSWLRFLASIWATNN